MCGLNVHSNFDPFLVLINIFYSHDKIFNVIVKHFFFISYELKLYEIINISIYKGKSLDDNMTQLEVSIH